MRLNKILDLSKNPTTNAELLTRYIFGDRVPTKFIPGKYYTQGEYVYIRENDGSLKVYMVNIPGEYDSIDTTHFVPATIPSMVQYILGTADIGSLIEHITAGELNDSDGEENLFDFITYTKDDMTIEGNSVEIPNDGCIDEEVYVNGCRLSKILGDYTISDNRITFKNDLNPDDEIMIIGIKANHSNARLIKHYDTHPVKYDVASIVLGDSEITDKGIVAYAHKGILAKYMIFDVYYKGEYVPENHYRYTFDRTTGKLVIDLEETYSYKGNIRPSSLDDIVIAFTYSLSTQFKVSKCEIKEIAPIDRPIFQIDVRDSIDHITNDIRVYNDAVITPPSCIVVDNYYVAIKDNTYHVPAESSAIIVCRKYEVVEVNIDGTAINTSAQKNNETVYIHASDVSKVIPVPFIDWDDKAYDVLLFREDGLFVDNTRYYVEDGYAVFYNHDDTDLVESMLNFVLLDRSTTFRQYYKQVKITEDHLTNGITIPIPYNYTIPMLLFRGEESYITRNKYVIDGKKITFVDDIDIVAGDIVTMVFLEYVGAVVDSVAKLFSIKTTEKNAFDLPLATYNPNTDSLVMMREDGVYIGIHNYKVVNNQKVVIDDEDALIEIGTNLDILVIRDLECPTFVENIPTVLELF